MATCRLDSMLLLSFVLACTEQAAVADSADDWARMKSIVPRGYVCYRTVNPVTVDGRVDDAEWKHTPWTADFVDIEGDRKPKPRFRTRARMQWDDEFFYVAAVMEEPHVWGTLTKHDSVIFHDNDFEIFIDPNSDNHEYYEFEMNALNTGWDLFLPRPYKDGGRADNSWEIPGLRTAVHVDGTLNDPTDTDRLWSVEIALPWTVLRESACRQTPPADGDQWRINFSRVEWKHRISDGKYEKVPKMREDNWVWSPQGIIDMHRPERWGYVQFSTARPGTTEFQPDATLHGRDLLMGLYHHQKSFHRKHKRWADSIDELALDPKHLATFPNPPTLTRTPAGYTATLDLQHRDKSTTTLSVQQDSLLLRSDSAPECAIRKVLHEQASAWNSGDIDGFMKHYWKSERLSFSSGGTTRYGWQATRDRFQERYPTKELMGKLTYGGLKVTPLGRDSALVLGTWQLERDEPIGGNFSLVFRRIDARWVIIHDHTSMQTDQAD